MNWLKHSSGKMTEENLALSFKERLKVDFVGRKYSEKHAIEH
jgi:hypothetical protein